MGVLRTGLVFLGRSYQRAGRSAPAAQALGQAAELAPQRLAAWQALGTLYAWLGDVQHFRDMVTNSES